MGFKVSPLGDTVLLSFIKNKVGMFEKEGQFWEMGVKASPLGDAVLF